MIDWYLLIVCNFSIAIAVVIGLIRYRDIPATYQPFLYIIMLSLLCEATSRTMIDLYHRSNAIVVNIYVLVEWLLWMWQFKNWKGFKRYPWAYTALIVTLPGIWIAEKLVMGKINTFNSVFAIISAFSIVFLAINQINRLIVEEKRNLLRNARFLICTGVIIFYTYKIMIDSFYVFKLNLSEDFLSNIFNIVVFVNVFVNLLYALAVLWIPTRQKFTLPS